MGPDKDIDPNRSKNGSASAVFDRLEIIRYDECSWVLSETLENSSRLCESLLRERVHSCVTRVSTLAITILLPADDSVPSDWYT